MEKIINTFRNRIECMHARIPYRIKGKWYNESLHVPGQPIQIQPYLYNGTYITPVEGDIVPVVIVERNRRVYARYKLTKVWRRSLERKTIYTDDDVFCNLTFHSIMYTI